MNFSRRQMIKAISIVPVAFAAGTSSSHAQPERGGTLTFGINSESSSIVPINTTTGFALEIGPKIFEGLVYFDKDFRAHPQLATDWSVSDDGLTYTFKLRSGVFWHDGTTFTSEDVAFSINRLKEGHPRGRVTFKNIVDVETPDGLTAAIKLSAPAPYLLTALAVPESPIVPKHLYAPLNPADTPPDSALVGTGPFVFKEWKRGSYLVLDRNPRYWDEGKPYLDRIVGRIITDSGARSAALETGEVDLAGIVLSDVDRFRSISGLAVGDFSAAYQGRHSQIALNLESPVLSNVKARKAIAHALDFGVIKDVIFYGHGTISPTPIAVALSKYHKADISPYEFSLEKADALFDEAGFPRDRSGHRARLRVVSTPENSRLSNYLQQQLKALGIETDVIIADYGGFVKKVYNERDFDIALDALGNASDPTIGVQRVFWSKAIKVGVPFANPSHYANAEVDRLLEQASIETDEAERKRLFYTFQDIIHDELPVIDYLDSPAFYAYRSNLTEIVLGAHGTYNNFANTYFQK